MKSLNSLIEKYEHLLDDQLLSAENMGKLRAEQLTVLAYAMFRREMLEGGMVQLIHNGYGPFIFLNPFAKAMRLWGLRDFCNLLYDGRRLYEKYGKAIEADCTDEAFMALYEQYPEMDVIDDAFVEEEPAITSAIEAYADAHPDLF